MILSKDVIRFQTSVILCLASAAGPLLAAEKTDRTQPLLTPTYSTAFSAAVDEIVNTTILKLKIPSVTVAVAHNGVMLHTGAYGLSHVKADVVPTPATIYLLDSMTKQFTAAGIMLLVQDGKLDIDKPVKTYIPYAPPRWDRITLRHLLTHTSGLPHDPQWGYPSVKSQDEDPDRLLKHHIFNARLKTVPGQKYAYSNTGYACLGAIISKVSGMPYSHFMNERIFLPLKMTSTAISFSGGDVKHGARGYNYISAKKEWSLNADANQPLAAGAIESTVLDLAKWDAALNGNTILTAASKQEMWKSYKLNSGQMSNYGFGWVPETVNGEPLVWHNGGGWGFNNAFYRYLGQGLTVIVLTNLEFEASGTSHADQLAQDIAAAYSPDLAMDNANGSDSKKPSDAGDTSGTSNKKDDPKAAKAPAKKGGGDPDETPDATTKSDDFGTERRW